MRLAWVHGRRGLGQLWRAPSPNARYFIYSSVLWSAPISLTSIYKPLYLAGLGLSNLAIGGANALEMSLRVVGVLLGAGLATRFGHKSVLIVWDIISWVIPTLILAFATEPWHAYLAAFFFATNSLVQASVQQLMLEDTPVANRANTFALLNLVGILPAAILPFMLGGVVTRWELVPAMRVLFGIQALCMGCGILWRQRSLRESSAARSQGGWDEILDGYVAAARHLLHQAGFLKILGAFVLANVVANLWQTYFGLYVVQSLGQPKSMISYITQARSIMFLLGSLYLVPRMSRLESGKGFALASILTAAGPLLLVFARGPLSLTVLSALGGLFAAAHAALLNARIADFLPRGSEGLAFSLCTAVMLIGVALGFSLTGALFDSHFSAFPWICLGATVIQAGLVWRTNFKANR